MPDPLVLLRPVAEAALGTAVDDHAVEAVRGLIEHLPALDRAQLHAGLVALEAAGPLFAGRPGRFSSLDPAGREAVLRGWLSSRLPLRRQLASALRTLAAFGHYGHEHAWAAVGYDGPWLGRMDVEVLPAPELAAPPSRNGPAPGVTSLRALGREIELRAEVCVIGSGAGGAAAAARLAEHGRDVVVLEGGPLFSAADVTQRELDTLPRLYRDAGLRSTADKAVGILQGRGVGGSTLHNTGLVYPPPEAIVDRWHREHGFPEPDALLADADEVVAALRAVPIPEEEVNANNRVLRAGADALGWRTRVPLHNRVACSACGYCMLGCAYNRKWNAAFAWLPAAVERGVRIVSDAAVRRIERANGGWRVHAGRVLGPRLTVRAERVVLAAGALETPALLRRSRLGPPSVGTGLRLHPAAVVAAVFDAPIHAWRGLPQSVLLEEFADFQTDGYGGFLVIPGAANGPALAAALTAGLGTAHRVRMRALPNVASAAVMVHDETRGRVRAGGGGRPTARYWPDRDDREELRRGIEALARAYLAAGARRVVLPFHDLEDITSEGGLRRAMGRARIEPHRVVLNSVHPQGSCALGVSPEAATRPDGALRGERGIFVSDTSLFPASIGVPPQVSTMALARRVADGMAG